MIKTITKDNFKEEVENAETPVAVELWAPWCMYCRRLAPALDRISEKVRRQSDHWERSM
jgi:thioredoxin 1